MYPAIFSRTYAAKSAADVFAVIIQDGYRGAQMNLSSLGLESLPANLPAGIVENAGELARKSGLRLAALSGTYNMVHPDAAYRAEMRTKFDNVLIAAKAMGAPIVTLCTGSRNTHNMWEAHPDNSTAAVWKDLREELDHALALAEAHDLTLAIEPEPGNVIRDATVARKLLDEFSSPHLKIILDAANLIPIKELSHQHDVMREAADLLGADTVLAHAKDFDVAGKVVAPGTGVVDLKFFAQQLKRAGYDSALIGHGFEAADASRSAVALTHLCALQE
jgi:sugar phosphate isomerase/epimerase